MTRVGATILLEVDNGQPVLRPRGYHSASKTYVYNSEFRDYVLLDSVDGTGNRITHYFIVRNFGDNIKGVTPVPGDKSSNRRWEESSKIEFIVANSITADMIQAGAITASKIQVAGFNFDNNNIWGGAKFGEGAGIDILSSNLNSNRAFRAYKDGTHYVEMFYREDEWGFKGVDGDVNNPIFSLGRKLVGGTWEDQNIVAGWSMTDSGFTSNKFIAPSYDDNGNLISWGSGSKLLSNGGLMISPANNGILPPSTGAMQAARIAAVGDNALILGLEVIAHGNGYLKEITALKLSAKNDYSTPKKPPVALEIVSGDFNFSNGIFYMAGGTSEVAVPVLWQYSSNGTIPTAGIRLVYVQGNTGGDNPCKLSTYGAKDGQVITIVNTSTNHRINVTGTAKGNHWILEGCCGTFRYLSGYGLWYPERFDW